MERVAANQNVRQEEWVIGVWDFVPSVNQIFSVLWRLQENRVNEANDKNYGKAEQANARVYRKYCECWNFQNFNFPLFTIFVFLKIPRDYLQRKVLKGFWVKNKGIIEDTVNYPIVLNSLINPHCDAMLKDPPQLAEYRNRTK